MEMEIIEKSIVQFQEGFDRGTEIASSIASSWDIARRWALGIMQKMDSGSLGQALAGGGGAPGEIAAAWAILAAAGVEAVRNALRSAGVRTIIISPERSGPGAIKVVFLVGENRRKVWRCDIPAQARMFIRVVRLDDEASVDEASVAARARLMRAR